MSFSLSEAANVSVRSPRSALSRAPQAFTLLEVMIALAIFAMAAIVMGAAYVNVLNSYELASRGTQSDEDLRFARALVMAEADLKKVNDGGDFDAQGGRRVHWSADAQPTNLPDLFSVTLTCEFSDGSSTSKRTETFRLLRPTWSEDKDRDKLREDVKKRIQDITGDSDVAHGSALRSLR